MSSTEIEALRRRWRQELASEDSKTFKGAAPPLDEQAEKPSLDMKQLLRLRSPMDIARPKLKPSFGDMAGGMWPPKIDPGKPLVIPRGPIVAAQKKRAKRSVRR